MILKEGGRNEIEDIKKHNKNNKKINKTTKTKALKDGAAHCQPRTPSNGQQITCRYCLIAEGKGKGAADAGWRRQSGGISRIGNGRSWVSKEDDGLQGLGLSGDDVRTFEGQRQRWMCDRIRRHAGSSRVESSGLDYHPWPIVLART